jgi:hypothetical protein
MRTGWSRRWRSVLPSSITNARPRRSRSRSRIAAWCPGRPSVWLGVTRARDARRHDLALGEAGRISRARAQVNYARGRDRSCADARVRHAAPGAASQRSGACAEQLSDGENGRSPWDVLTLIELLGSHTSTPRRHRRSNDATREAGRHPRRRLRCSRRGRPPGSAISWLLRAAAGSPPCCSCLTGVAFQAAEWIEATDERRASSASIQAITRSPRVGITWGLVTPLTACRR